jgi:hypothetical protein
MKRRFLSTTLLLGLMVTPALAADKSLVLYLPFDDGAGTTVTDLSSYRNNGTLTGDAVWITGHSGTALQFVDGSHVTIPEIPQYDVSVEASVMAWVRAGTNPNWGRVVDKSQWQTSGFDLVLTQTAGLARLEFFVNETTSTVDSTTVVMDNEWHFITGTFNNAAMRMYVDGVLEGENTSINNANINPNDWPIMIAGETSSSGGQQYFGDIDEVAIYDRELSEDEILDIFVNGMALPEFAGGPQPSDKATDVPPDTTLSWTAGGFAATHDVYLGTNADDVNAADRSNDLGVLVSQGQTAIAYRPDEPLAFGRTYYWRIDEVNAAPDETIFKGELWSFTVEPFLYAIENIIATSNGTAIEGFGPENTVNGIGLNANDQHSTLNADMWAATTAGAEPVWIQYEFDQIYQLTEMQVWNYNVVYESMIGFGFQDVTIEYSADGVDWTVLKDAQFAQAPGTTSYTAGTVVDLEGIPARFLRLTANSNYGTSANYGLSEVRFIHKPALAREPNPADGATDVSVDALLDWRGGRDAVSHAVYLGTAADALALADTVAETQYQPGGLDLDTTYYWRVDEVNEAEAIDTWEGLVWSFATQPYLTIDDFESYTDDEGNRIYETWDDGWINDTGSTVGYLDAPFTEQTIVHAGRQSMPLLYEGDSEVDLAVNQDWTRYGIATLTLFVHGDLDNDDADVYVKINGARVAGGVSPTMALWKQWNIDLTATVANLSNVATLTIGVEGSGSGTIYVDDIRLYRAAPEVVTPIDPGTDGLALHYAFENNVTDGSGYGYDGTPQNDPFYDDAAGDLGRAMSFDGINDYVDLPIGSLIASLSDITITAWVNVADGPNSWQRVFDFGSTSTGGYMFLCPRTGTTGPLRFAIQPPGGTESLIDSPSNLPAGWHHIATAIDSASMTMALYIDGVQVAGGTTATLPSDLGSPTQNWLGRSQYEADGYLEALLADFRIYDRALAPGEIRYLAGDR